MVDISGLDDHECHFQCQWQRVTEYVYCEYPIMNGQHNAALLPPYQKDPAKIDL